MKNFDETKFIEDLNSFNIFENIINENNVNTKYDIFHDHFLNPIPHGVFWITHTWGGRFCPPPCNTAILKDMDLKFGMLK